MLAELYSVSSVFVNPTYQDNYPTVNLEAIACGTPVVTYRTGGSIESITDATGRIVGQGDTDGLLAAVREIEVLGKTLSHKLAGSSPLLISEKKTAITTICNYTKVS